ncbi:hypothetical protein ACS0TY_009210 [Phlomoides rotata]
MGILSWFSKAEKKESKPDPKPEHTGMNGAVEVRRPEISPVDISVFEFGSAADKVTLAGYCPVSDDLEPCRWEIIPAGDSSNAPQFRVVF